MRDRISGEKIGRSSYFRSARKHAVEYLKNPARLNRLIDRATQKIYHRQGPFSEIRDSLQASFRLLRAYAGGSYREIPAASLISIIASIIYFVMPIDVIPDFILALGLVDDAALLGWVLSSVKSDIDHFVAWEREQSGTDEPASIAEDATRED
ncbi:MAG: DUF1232 domain-containing protein [Gammaproteobacteria bacterium]|jgi:uncharacterized membrane protein YkvA (DUF1232 family)